MITCCSAWLMLPRHLSALRHHLRLTLTHTSNHVATLQSTACSCLRGWTPQPNDLKLRPPQMAFNSVTIAPQSPYLAESKLPFWSGSGLQTNLCKGRKRSLCGKRSARGSVQSGSGSFCVSAAVIEPMMLRSEGQAKKCCMFQCFRTPKITE